MRDFIHADVLSLSFDSKSFFICLYYDSKERERKGNVTSSSGSWRRTKSGCAPPRVPRVPPFGGIPTGRQGTRQDQQANVSYPVTYRPISICRSRVVSFRLTTGGAQGAQDIAVVPRSCRTCGVSDFIPVA